MKDTSAKEYLNFLNTEYYKLHKRYEDLFWISYMGDQSVDRKKDAALKERDAFRSNTKYPEEIKKLIKSASKEEKGRLNLWLKFFSHYQTPPQALSLKEKIDRLESETTKRRSNRKEGYTDPYTKKFVIASANKMGSMIATHPDEKIRKACFGARERLALDFIDEYIRLIDLRNRYAKLLGYEDFYDYKLRSEDGITKKELFGLFDSIYNGTKYAQKNIRNLEKKTPGITKPWNFSYMMAGDFTKEEDPYFPFEEALTRWGRSFAALRIGFNGGKLTLDLLDRKGKWNNGFCHWPELVRFEKGRFIPGSANFTCNVVYGQIGSSDQGYNTLFHEGGHAAHLMNSEQEDVCVNHEYAPMTAAWAETQSMFLDTLHSGIEWLTRYAKNEKGEVYPFKLFERQAKKLHILRPLGLNGLMMVCYFEKEIYETKNLTKKKVLDTAKKINKKFSTRSEPSIGLLNVPHIYNWESSAGYHGYALATLALEQWRKYLYKKYGYIVDNPKVGREMRKVWKLGATLEFPRFVKMATGQKLSSRAFLENATLSLDEVMRRAEQKIKRLKRVKEYKKPVKLDAYIKMVSGKKKIADNKKSFEDMAERYSKWLKGERK